MTSPAPPASGWRRAVRVGYLLAVAAAFVVAVVARREELAAQLAGADLGDVALAAAAGIGGVGASGLIWRRLLHGLGSPLPLAPATRVFFLAQLGKYLPGSLWPVLAQAELGRDHGVPRRTAVAAQTLFMWVHLVTGALIGIPVLAATGVLPRPLAAAPLLLLPLLLPRPLSAAIDGLLRRLRRQPLPARPGGTDMAAATGWALGMWLLYGLHTYLLVAALEFPLPGWYDPVVATGAFAAAWSAGFLVLIAPAGAGAREVVLLAGLSTITTADTALAVALASRLLLTAADGVWGLAGLLVRRRRAP